ncbi:uncharacterized protein LOC133181399 [Saccostrea echinata]|uniref:uncharacterized protein LOC133181399 n=1 Tax=Saccostrea echinata TaxID=191078 RepID=UPI002A7EAED7|nr:uncharacterized protein LOC133181399 [Saccostrea echinata]
MTSFYFVLATTIDNTGEQFVAAFFRNLDLSKFDAYLIVAGVLDVNVTVNVIYEQEINKFGSPLQLSPGVVKQITLKEHNGETNMLFPVLRIVASHPVSITAFSDGPSSAASYLVFPLDVAGEEYRMMPFCQNSENSICVCSIVSLKKNTMVILENKNHGNISVFTPEHAVGKNTIDHLSLPNTRTRFLVKEIYSHVSLESQDDFTGLLLRANSSVVVFCGGRKQDATMSMEQIPPVDYYGKHFYTFPIAYNSMSPSKLRFVSHHNCTNITTVQGHYWLDAGEIQEISTKKVVTSHISSDKPIAIMQIFSGYVPNSRYLSYHEGLLLLPAIDQYVSTVIIPRRNRKNRAKIMKMFVGLITDVCYTLQSFSGDKSILKKTLSSGIIVEYDDSGVAVNLTRDYNCKICKGGFGGYAFRTNIHGNEASFSTIGYNFISREIENLQHLTKPCGNKQEDTSTQDTSETRAQHLTINMTLSSTESTQSSTAETTSTWTEISDVTDIESKQTTVSSEPTISQCSRCPCHPKPTPTYPQTTEEELQEKILEIKRDLKIKKNDLSSYRRSKTSAGDERISAKGIGIVGASILCSIVSLIVIMDFPTLAHQTIVLWRNMRGCLRGEP